MKLALLNRTLALGDAEQLITPLRSGLHSIAAVSACSAIEAGLYFADISFSEHADIQHGQIKDIVHQVIGESLKQSQTDFAVLPHNFSTKQFGLLATDMDSTLITIECIDEIADFVGKKAEVSAITEAAMRGEIKSFSESLTRRVALLKGVEAKHLESVFNERLRLSPGADTLLTFIKQQGWKTLLVSGGFTYFTERLKAELNLDFARSNTLEIIDGQLTGRVLGEIVDAQAKADTLRSTCAELGLESHQAIAMGDGANDLLMMKEAGLGVAYRAKPIVQEQTHIAINHHGLDALIAWFKVTSAQK